MSESTDRVLIAGGGIAGLATAARRWVGTVSLPWSSNLATRRSTQGSASACPATL